MVALRICQKHFLKEFLGASFRLVGHAAPAPYGVPLECLNAEKFMVDCANLKSNSTFNNHQQTQLPEEQHLSSNSYCLSNPPISANENHNYTQLETVTTSTNSQDEQPLLIPVDQSNYHQRLVDNTPLTTSHENVITDIYAHNSSNQCVAPYISNHEQQQNSHQTQSTQDINSDSFSYALSEINQSELDPVQDNHEQAQTEQEQTLGTESNVTVPRDSIPCTTNSSRTHRIGNPKINYDRNGKIVSIKYQTETLSMLKADENEYRDRLIEALKQKVHHYQRKLAVTNHRYQKLKSQQKGRSPKSRLLDCLKVCKKNFEPCIYEIFKRQIKGPTSKHGNRWPTHVKSFAASIYLRSRPAYKHIRETVDLPSESIVKRFMNENKVTKASQLAQLEKVDDNDEDDDDDEDDCNDDDDGDDNDDERDHDPEYGEDDCSSLVEDSEIGRSQ